MALWKRLLVLVAMLATLAACEQGAVSFAGDDAHQALDYGAGDAPEPGDVAETDGAIGADEGSTVDAAVESNQDADTSEGVDDGDAVDGHEPDPDVVAPDVVEATPDAADEPDAAEASDEVDGPGPIVPAPVTVTDSDTWARIERYSWDNDGLVPEPTLEKTRPTDPEIVAAFGTDAPPVTDFLLHAAPGWDSGSGPVVLLVPGAGTDATEAFMQPALLNDAALARALPEQGCRVFALTFAAPFGSNRNQAVTVAQALQVLRARLGVAQVSVVAHSKGGLAVLAYVRGLVAAWGLPYDGDVERLVLLGVPLGGLDWPFRHPNTTYTTDLMSLPMPTVWDRILEWGTWKDLTDQSIYGGAYDGLLEALTPWLDAYLLSGLEQDWYTTWYGGTGFVSHSLGIDAAVELGGHFMDALHVAPMPPSLPVAVLAGGNAFVGGVAWETTGPSDGLVFVASATDVSDFEAAGCPILGVDTLLLENHWSLLSSPDALAFVQAALTASF